jgi:predicted GH43/DUF377 family glycosyl hydrolase
MNIKQIRPLFPDHQVARYNLAAWQNPKTNSVYFLGRVVDRAGRRGEPDSGNLKLFEMDHEGVMTSERLIWEPSYDGINLEDPRALELPNESLLVGLTAVLRDKKGRPVPFPAIIKIASVSTWHQELPPFLIITSFGPGKNITPIDDTTYLFRPDNRDYHHKILVFSLHHQVPQKLADIVFPTDLPWAKWRIGTTMPPIWLNETEALFIIHGITIKKEKGIKRYIYSLGRAKLVKEGNSFSVTVFPEPILTPDNFLQANGSPLVPELHPKLRRVVYSCGGIIKKPHHDSLSLYVNVGDRTTFEVQYSLSELKQDLF